MKKLILALILFATPVQAQQLTCEEIADTCGMIMEIRQNGSPMSQLLGVVSQTEPALADAMTKIIYGAYQVPVKGTKHERYSAKVDFQDSCLRICQEELK